MDGKRWGRGAKRCGEEKRRDVLRKYRKITVACSSAISYVASKNVVHSIERSNSVSDSSGGGWRLMIEGSVSGSAGRDWKKWVVCVCSSEEMHR